MTPPRVGQVLSGPSFDEPMRIETITDCGTGSWKLGLVGARTERYRSVILTVDQINELTITDPTLTYFGDPALLRLGIQAYSLGIAYEFDPYFGLSISRVDPLPHQLEAVYDYLLKLARVRFLLADDAGAGKTIMAGLLIKELQLRGLADRILVVCPANLAFQWQRELKEKFDAQFTVLRGNAIREQFGANQWMEQSRVITSLDLAKRTEILPGLRQVHWDLVIVDEAHRLSWSPPSKKTARYSLGELLRDATDHFLLLTATPHKGDAKNFSVFLQLLDSDAFADVTSINEAMNQRRAPFYLRRTKEAMVYFPEKQPDGTWAARKIFTKRIPHTVDFHIDGAEDRLYRDVSLFVKNQSARAAEDEGNPRARAVGFLMALYQRRLTSSTYALRHSLENRAKRLEDALKKAQELLLFAPANLPDPEELEEMEDEEREKFESMIEAISLARNHEQVQEEIAELLQFAQRAKAVEESECEAKLSKLKELLISQGFQGKPDQRLLIFTEFKDTLDYLVGKLEDWGYRVGFIHGSMKPGSRDEPGTRLYSEQQFRDGDIQILVATEAAGEGINLQVCHIMFNYDIPWNPNRLEQRMGRIHRYGQKEDCLIFNFVATNTVEGHVLQKLLEKLQEIRDALDDDSVFNVVGELLPPAHVERVLRDYYAKKLGDGDLEDRILEPVEEGRFRAICQNALEGLATKNLNLKMLIERQALAQEKRVVPETIARFMTEAAMQSQLVMKPVQGLSHTFEGFRTPTALKQIEKEPDWKLPPIAQKYPRLSTDRKTAEDKKLEWVTPGHPLFEALRRNALEKAQSSFGAGACFYSLQHEAPARLDLYRARVVDGMGRTIHEKLFGLELSEGTEPVRRDPGVLGNLIPAARPPDLPGVAFLPEAVPWLTEKALQPLLDKTRDDRLAELDRIAKHVELSLGELIGRADFDIGRAVEAKERGETGAEGRLAAAENRHTELTDRRTQRRKELERQQSLTLQAVERIASILILPHPEREAPEVRGIRPNPVTEATAMRVAIEHESTLGRQVFDIHEKNLGYDITSLDLNTGELRLIEVKGLAAPSGPILLTPNERRVAEDRRECYWLYVVTNCAAEPILQEPIQDPAKFPWHEVVKVQHYWLDVNAMTQPTVGDTDSPQFESSHKRE